MTIRARRRGCCRPCGMSVRSNRPHGRPGGRRPIVSVVQLLYAVSLAREEVLRTPPEKADRQTAVPVPELRMARLDGDARHRAASLVDEGREAVHVRRTAAVAGPRRPDDSQ